MVRRLRREFQALEAQLEPDAQAREWRALIDKVLYDKGPGPKPIGEQLALQQRLKTVHARRDRYNLKRLTRRYEKLRRQIRPRHVIAALAIRTGAVESEMSLRDMMIGAMAGDSRLSRKFIEELETIHETIHPSVPARDLDHRRIAWECVAEPATREERRDFEEALKRTALPEEPPAAIPFGFPVPLSDESDVPEHQVNPPAARQAS